MNSPNRLQQIEALFHAALEHQPAERAAFLSAACASDPRYKPKSKRCSPRTSKGAACSQPHQQINLQVKISRQRCCQIL